MLKRKYYGIILLCAVIACVCVIIGFTLQNADDSSSTSTGVLSFLLRTFYPGYNDMSASEQQQISNGLHNLIRKLAHFSEYAALGGLLCLFWRNVKVIRHPVYTALGCGLTVGAVDEFIQNFVPGRAAMVTDVMIDFSGVCVGAFIMTLLANAVVKRTAKRRIPQ